MTLRQKKFLVPLACLLSMVCLVGSAFATNLVLNGDFELGNNGAFTSAYGPVSNAPDQSVLYPEGKYTVGANPNFYHNLWASYGDHTSGSGNMMIVNGAGSPVDVWATAIPIAVTAQTQYYLSAWVASSYPDSPADLVFKVNNIQMGSDFVASTNTGVWQQYYSTWYSGSNTTVSLSLFNLNTAAGGNDFTLDDISLSTVRPDGTPVGGTVPLPSTMLLLGSGLVGLGLLRRKWSLKK